MTLKHRGRPRRRPSIAVGLILLGLAAAALGWWIAYNRATQIEVFFVRFDAAHHRGSLVPVLRRAAPGSVEARLNAALRALLDGPGTPRREDERDLVTEIPTGTVLLDVRVDGGIVTVNLSKTYAAGGGSTSMLARVWQVVYTATQFPGAEAAQIIIEGRRVRALGGEGVMIGAPIRRPTAPPSF